MNIQFKKVIEESTILNPMKNFSPERQTAEFRMDPLTGRECFNLTAAKGGLKLPSTIDEKQMNEIAEKTREGCFMCPENVDNVTPKFPPEILPEGRLHGVGATLFPNTLVLSKFTAVVALKSHYLRLSEYTPDILLDAFVVALRFIKRIHELDPVAEYAAIGCNCLFPAGASVTHPHIHVLIDEVPFYYVTTLLNSSKRYFDEHSTSYWGDLVEAEQKEGERYLGSIGDTDWLVPFATSGMQEVQAIIRNKSSFMECTEDDMKALAQGLSKVLKYYSGQGIHSFNYLIYSGPLRKRIQYFSLGLRVVSRFNLAPLNASDIPFRKILLERYEAWAAPEVVASLLRKEF